MAAEAKIISMSDAREARRRRLSEKSRVSPEDLAKHGAKRNTRRRRIAAAAQAIAAGEKTSTELAREGELTARERAQARAKAAKYAQGRGGRHASASMAGRRDEDGLNPRRRYVVRETINNFLSRPLMASAALFCVLIVLVGVFLFPTARTYYQAIREQARLEAEFAAVLDRNARMANEIDFLQTDEGIIQKARETLGWVQRGENAVIVYGTGRTEAELDADIVPGSVKAPETWYSRFLDPLFGVE